MSSISHKGKIYANQFLLKKKISSGSFGDVYLGYDIKTQDQYAIKVEKNEADNSLSIEREVAILKHLSEIEQVPRLIWSGKENGDNVMVIQLLGRDLTYYLRIYRRFSVNCVFQIADNLIGLLENIHQKGILHRDIKPENVLTGREKNQNTLYLVDFGISKVYKERKTGQHIPFIKNKPFIGTTRYASIAAHKGHEIGRKDDLESLGYMLVYLLRGTLPWVSIQAKNENERCKLVGQLKLSVSTQELCKDLPDVLFKFQINFYIELVDFLSYQLPNYKQMQLMFRQENQNQFFDKKFDWSEPKLLGSNTGITTDQPLTKNRNSSAEPRSQKVVNQLGTLEKKISQNPFSTQRILQINSIKSQVLKEEHNNDEQVSNNSLLRGSFQKSPKNQPSLLTIERKRNQQKSMSSFNSSQNQIDNSCFVEFQPSILANSQVSINYGMDEVDQQYQNQNDILEQIQFSSSKIPEVLLKPKRELKPVSEKRAFSLSVSQDIKFGTDLRFFTKPLEYTEMTITREQQLNEEENMDLCDKYNQLSNVSKKFKSQLQPKLSQQQQKLKPKK